MKQLGAGIIITGGGAQLKNMRALVQSLSGVDVRTTVGVHLLTEDSISDDFKNHLTVKLLVCYQWEQKIAYQKLLKKNLYHRKNKKLGKIYSVRFADSASQRLTDLFTDNSDTIQ